MGLPRGLEDANPWTGELVTFTKGTLHVVTHVTEDSGGGFHAVVEFNGTARGVSDTGTRYVGSGHNGDAFATGPGRAETFTFVGHFNLVSRGSGENAVFKAAFHVTIAADGQVGTEFERLAEPVCRG